MKNEIRPRTDGAHFISGEVIMRGNHLTQSRKKYGKEVYGTTILFSRFDDDTLNKINEAMKAAYDLEQWKFCEDGTETTFEELSNPIKPDNSFKDKYFMRCISSERPGLVDADLKEMEEEPVAGCTGRVSVSFHCKKVEDKKILYPVLENVQITKNKAERRYKVEDDFCALSELTEIAD